MKHSNTIFLSLLVIVFLSLRCRPEGKPEPVYIPADYKFSEKITLSPYKKTYVIGDTIWIQFETADKTLFDEMTSTRIATDTTYLNAFVTLDKRYPHINVSEFYADIKTDSIVDISFESSYNRYNVLKFKTACNTNRYFFRIGYILRKTGIFTIEPQSVVWNCPTRKSFLNASFKFMFDLIDCNKDIWLTIPAIYRDGENTDARIDNKQIFVFKVE